MFSVNEYGGIRKNPLKILLVQYVLIMALSLSFAGLTHRFLIRYFDIYPAILQLICMFIIMSIFMCVWHTSHCNLKAIYILCLGYLAMFIFQIPYIFYFLKLNLNSDLYFDLSAKYSMLNKFIEALNLLLFIKSKKIRFNKWIGAVITIITALGISYFICTYNAYLPVLRTRQGVTPVKMALEYMVIGLYLIIIFNIKDKVTNREIVTYKYIFLYLLINITSEICFIAYVPPNSFIWTFVDILKIIAYYFLFRGIFISAISYPYEKLEIEQKKLEEKNKELKHISETLNDLLDSIPIAVQKYDLNGRLKYVNKKFEELMDCDRNTLYGLTAKNVFERFLNVEDHEELYIYEIFKNENIDENLGRSYKTVKGDKIRLTINSHIIRNGVLMLINDTKKEQELENLHIQTETILNAVSNCIIMIDKNKNIILCNEALEEVLEMNKKDIIGMNIEYLNDLIGFSNKDIPTLSLQKNVENQFSEVSFTSLKGNRKELLLHFTSIVNIDGEVIGGIHVSTDITEMKKEQEKILQQEKLALLGQMGAGIVHETRNYLTTIKGRSQLIKTSILNEEVKKHAIKINEEVDEVNRIISEFLFLSKPKETELIEVSLFDIFQSIQSMIKTSSLVKGIDIEIQLCKEERYMLCDEAQLKQVILNLCKNAVDAMCDKTNAKLKIETGYNEETNEMFIKTSDNGKGIYKEDLKKIGTPFFTTKESGTGLGLSVCYKIIKEHHGRIEVESTLGEGTTFTVILPCIEDEEFDEVM